MINIKQRFRAVRRAARAARRTWDPNVQAVCYRVIERDELGPRAIRSTFDYGDWLHMPLQTRRACPDTSARVNAPVRLPA